MTNLIRLVGTSAAEGEGSSPVDFSPAPRQSWTMRGSSCCLLIHVTDTHSSTKSGTFFFSFELCALFGGRSLTAHLGELLAGGSHQVRPPVDARVQEDPSAGSSTAPRHTTRPRTGHRGGDRAGPARMEAAARDRQRPHFRDLTSFRTPANNSDE